MSRGNSLVAGVVLIGLLSTLAIALQSANPQVESDAQVATAYNPTSRSQLAQVVTAPSKTAGPDKMGCFEGFSYEVRTVKGNVEVSCSQKDESKCVAEWGKGKYTTEEEYKKAGALEKECRENVSESKKKQKAGSPACKVAGAKDCEILHCFTPKGSTQEKCVKLKNGTFTADGEKDAGFSPKNNQDFALKQLAEQASAGDSPSNELLKQLKADPSMTGPIKNAFGEVADGKIYDQTKEQIKAKEAAEAELKKASDVYQNCTFGGEMDCDPYKKQVEDAEKKVADEKKKLDDLERQRKWLYDQSKSLDPSKTKEKDGTGNPTCTGANCKADPGPGNPGPGNPGGGNPGGGNPGGGSPGGGQPGGQQPQSTFPQQQQQQQNQQCSWFQALFSSCPQLECKIQASPPNLQPPQPGQPQQPVTLQWQTTGGNAQYASITNLGTVPPNGQAQVNPQMTTMYSMRVQGQNNQSADCQTTVTVGTQNQPTQPTQPGTLSLTFSAVPSSIALGETAKLKWSSPASTCTASEGWSGTKTPSGEESVSPLKTTTYSLACQGNLGSATRQVTITVSGSPTSNAEISCSPKIADVGMKVAIAYSCKNAVKGVGVGFSTNDQTSGSAEVTIEKPPAGTDTVSYGLTCTSEDGKEVNASPVCKVQINKPSLILVANPKIIDDNDEKPDTTTLGWITKGMKSCVISSPDDAEFTEKNKDKKNTSGSLKTDELDEDTEFVLTCITLADQEKVTRVEVDVI